MEPRAETGLIQYKDAVFFGAIDLSLTGLLIHCMKWLIKRAQFNKEGKAT